MTIANASQALSELASKLSRDRCNVSVRSESLVGILVFGTPNSLRKPAKDLVCRFRPEQRAILRINPNRLYARWRRALRFRHDGFLDIFFTNGARIPTLEKGRSRILQPALQEHRDGTFTDVTERAGLQGGGYSMESLRPTSTMTAGPPLPDGVNRNILYHNNGDGTFTDITEQAGVSGVDSNGKKLWSVGAAWFDYAMTDCLIFLSQIIWIGL